MTDRNTPPSVGIPDALPMIEPEELVLDNGLPVYLLEGGSEEILKIELVFFAGAYYQVKPLIADTTASLLKAGTKNKTSREIDEAFDFYGSFFSASAQKDIATVGVFVLNKYLQQVLGLMQEVLSSPVYPHEEIAISMAARKQQHLINSQKVQYLSRLYFNELLYGSEHPYGVRLDSGDFDRVYQADLVDYHQTYYHPGNAFCIVAGKIPPDIGQLLNQTLGSAHWAGRPPIPGPKYGLHSAAERKMLVEKPDAIQSAIRIGRRLFNRTHPDYHPLMIANALLGGFFGSRLMQNIRQDKGYTYGIGSGLVSLLRDGYFFVSSEVGVEYCQQAIDEIYAELAGMRKRPAGADELETLKSYLSGSFLRSFDGPFAQSERFKEVRAFRMSMAHYDGFIKALQQITAEDIMQLSEKYLHEDAMIELVVGRK